MIIGIDARLLGPEQGGLGRYLQELMRHLEKIDQENDYVIFLRKQNWESFNPTNKNFHKILADLPWYGIKEQLYLAKIIKKQKIDLMHFPHWNVPFFYNKPYIITLHDLILLHFPDRQNSTRSFFSYKFKYLTFKIILHHAVWKAQKILTPSNFVKNDLIKTLNIPLEKIVVTTEGLSKPTTPSAPNEDAKILEQYQIKKPFLLYVGVAFPHKNLLGLIEYFDLFQQKYHINYQLVLAGKKNYFYKKIENFIKIKNLQNIILTDFIKDKDLPILYRQAKAFVYPSLYEGFGLPPLEAMSQGTPVLAAETSCLPEILEKGALFFNPQDKQGTAEAIFKILTDENLRQILIKNGYEQIQKYSWNRCAQLTLQAYKNSV